MRSSISKISKDLLKILVMCKRLAKLLDKRSTYKTQLHFCTLAMVKLKMNEPTIFKSPKYMRSCLGLLW